MNFNFVVLLYILLILNILNNTSGLHTKRMLVSRLDTCFVAEDGPLIVHYYNVDRLPDNHYSASGCAELLYDLENKDISVYLDIFRCANKESLDSCEFYTKLMPPMHICNFLKLKDIGVYDFMNKITPPCFCPFKKGNYTAKDMKYRLEDFTLFPIGNYFWKLQLNASYKKKKMAILCLEGQIIDRYT